jgi:hypothetical protein
MKDQLRNMFAAGGTLAVLGLATPAWADGPLPVVPVEMSGSSLSCADVIPSFAFPRSPRPGVEYVELFIANPTSASNTTHASSDTSIPGTTFQVDITQDPDGTGDSNVYRIVDSSTFPEQGTPWNFGQSQISDLPGFEIVIMNRNNANNVYFRTNMGRTGDVGDEPGFYFESAGTQTPSHITICYAIGPCGLYNQASVDIVANEYNNVAAPGTDTADALQADLTPHFGEPTPPMNVCALTDDEETGEPRVARYCDTSVAGGHPGSCNPDGEAYAGGSTTSLSTAGVASFNVKSDGTGNIGF